MDRRSSYRTIFCVILILAITVGCIEDQEPASIIHLGLAEDAASAIASCDMSTKGEGTSICYVNAAQELEDESLCDLIDDEPGMAEGPRLGIEQMGASQVAASCGDGHEPRQRAEV